MAKGSAKLTTPPDAWRVYLLVLQSVSIAGSVLLYQGLFWLVLSFGRSSQIPGLYPASSYAIGAYLLMILAVDVWALIDIVRRRPMTYHPIRISYFLTVVLAIFAIGTSGGSWQTVLYYGLVTFFSWTKILAVRRMIFKTRVYHPILQGKAKK